MPGFVARALQRHHAAPAERMLALRSRSELVIDNAIGQPWQRAEKRRPEAISLLS
jgi:hypothetical protein